MHDTRKRNDSDSPLRTTKPVTPTFTIYPRYTVLPGAKYKSVPRARQKETNHGEALIGACPVTTDCIVAMSYCENNNNNNNNHKVVSKYATTYCRRPVTQGVRQGLF